MTHPDPQRPEGRELPPTLASGEGHEHTDSGDLVGRVLAGRYRILRKLGEGAMGAVYLGEHLKIGRQDAIKVLRDRLATDPDTIARFVRGTRNVSMIRHPNICTIYDYSDTAGGIQFVAMEFVPGETLRDLLQREGRLPIEKAVHIARQAAEALEAAHEVGIVHRDLKPANIMVVRGRGGALEVKVVDFDIAKGSHEGEGEEVTRMGFVVGTPEYMSPEQLIGDRLDGRSDIYSLALVLYRMLTGTLPFTAQDTQDLMVKRLTEDPMPLSVGLPGSSFSPALEKAIRRALQRKPSERQESAAEFSRDIAAALPSAPAVPPRPAVPDSPPPSGRTGGASPASGGARHMPIVGAAVAVAGLAGVVALGLIALRGNEGESGQTGTLMDPPTQIVQYSDPLAGSDQVPEETGGAGEDAEAGESAPEVGGSASVEPQTEEVATEAPADQQPAELSQTSTMVSETAPAAPGPPSQDDLLSMLQRAMEPYPARSALLAIRDTAVNAWGDESITAQHRALAAYVAGSTLVALGDTAQAVTWLQRAVDLRPGYDPYLTDLSLYRRLISGDSPSYTPPAPY